MTTRARAARIALELAADLALLSGAASVVYGMAQITTPGAWILGGGLAMLAGWNLGTKLPTAPRP